MNPTMYMKNDFFRMIKVGVMNSNFYYVVFYPLYTINDTQIKFKWIHDNQSVLEEYSGGGSKENCSCSLYGGGGIGISDSPDIMEL